MKIKYFTFFLGLIFFTSAQAVQKNFCDDLMESGNTPIDQIKKCQDKYGVSDYAKEKEAQSKIKVETAKTEEASAAKKKDNLEFKKFSSADLSNEGFGKPFFAMRIDWRYSPPKEKRITDGDALCSYLGFEKSVKASLSAEIMPQDADKKGIIVDSAWITGKALDPEIYKDEDLKFTVRKYVEITCVKRKDKNADPSDEVYKKLTEDLLILPPEMNSPKIENNSSVNNGTRAEKNGKTPNGYNPPDWTKDAPATSISK